jgi:hypothetical protein
MAVIATNAGGGDRELIPPGNYIARCYSVIHIGHVEDQWKGQPKIMNKVRIAWEIPELMRTFDEKVGPQPMSISKEYTLSTGEKANLRKMLASWRGKDFTEDEAKGFDVLTVAGACCMINIIHKKSAAGNDYEDVISVAKKPASIKCPPLINKLLIWDFEKFDAILLECLPGYVRDKIKQSAEYKKATDPTNTDATSNFTEDTKTGDDDDDLPF